jgi:hypothetical protein
MAFALCVCLSIGRDRILTASDREMKQTLSSINKTELFMKKTLKRPNVWPKWNESWNPAEIVSQTFSKIHSGVMFETAI